MGLDVSFYEKATLAHEKHPHALRDADDEPGEECWDNFTVLWVNKDFPGREDGLPHRSCWDTERGEHIHHSYSGYNQYRAWLCMASYGVDCETVWADPDKYADRPFFEQIHFADNEGTIGPVTSAKLAQDYLDNREWVVSRFIDMPRSFDVPKADHDAQVERMVAKYDEWAKAFALVGETGFTVFS